MRVGWTHRWWLEIGPNRADSLVADCVQSFLSPFYFTVIVQMGGRQNGQNKKRESQRQKERERESHKRERERVIKNKQQKEKKRGRDEGETESTPASWPPQLRAHLCVKVWADPHVFAQVAWLPFLPLLSPTKDPLSFLSLQSPRPKEKRLLQSTLGARAAPSCTLGFRTFYV